MGVSRRMSRANPEIVRYVVLVIRGACGASMREVDSIAESGLDQEKLKELASIARLISYARQSAKSVDADFPVWCLDMALAAVLQEIYPASDGHYHPIDSDEDSGTSMRRH